MDQLDKLAHVFGVEFRKPTDVEEKGFGDASIILYARNGYMEFGINPTGLFAVKRDKVIQWMQPFEDE